MPSNEGAPNMVNTDSYRILVVGGSYAGLAAAVSILDLSAGRRCRLADDAEAKETPSKIVPVNITIVDERDGYYHLIGGPLAFADEKYAAKAWRRYDSIPALQHPNVKVIRGSIRSVDCKTRTAVVRPYHDGETICLDKDYKQSYDYLITATGLSRRFPACPKSLKRAEYLAETSQCSTSNRSARGGVVVIGGGAVGIEMAAELKLVEPTLKVTLIHSRSRLLSNEDLPDDFKDQALSLLQDAGVNVILNQRPTWNKNEDETYQINLNDGTILQAGQVINAVSTFTPTSTFLPSSALDSEGYINIQTTLQFTALTPNATHHFAAGDIAHWSGIKRCGAAIHQGHYAGVNLYQQILYERYDITPKFLELNQVPPMMGLAVGKQAVTYSEGDGLKYGEEQMRLYFGDDLGFDICWNYMRLGEEAVH